ncbi:MAG: GNAT family N-acetyltransferase [Beijerinckiaceae bacterium]|jgi:CelD/BcsL family acetyltransferase involved in cellulose biosynthesis
MARGATLDLRKASTETPPSKAALVARVDVHWDANPAVLETWAKLETIAPCSIYQTRAWLLPWTETLGRKAGLKPFYVIARGTADEPLALLCLGLRRAGPFKIAAFLGGKDSNFNMPLVQPGLSFGPEIWRALLLDAAGLMGQDRPCAFFLLNQPAEWSGQTNSLTQLTAQSSPNVAFGTKLTPSAEAFFAGKLSKATRKKLRQKEARLAARGALTYRTPAACNEKAAILDAFFAQKTSRFRAQNIVSGFDDPAMRRFIETASMPDPHGTGIELHALYSGGRIVAVYGGGTHRGCWSGMFNSFDASHDVARSSPGDLLLMAVMAKQCAAGTKHFDLGIGEARYKAMFCGDVIPLFDSFLALTPMGRLFLLIEALALRTKSGIKSHRALFYLARRLRALWLPRKMSA